MRQVRCKNCGDYVETSESNCPYCGEPMNAVSRFSKKMTDDIHTRHLEHEGEHKHHRGHTFNQAEDYKREPALEVEKRKTKSTNQSPSTFDLGDLEETLKKFTGSKKTKDGKKKSGAVSAVFIFYIVYRILTAIIRSIDF